MAEDKTAPECANYRAEYRSFNDDTLGNTEVDDLTYEFPETDDERALQLANQRASELERELKLDDVHLMNLLRYVKIH